MNLRTTLILFGLLAAALGVFALFQIFGVKTAAERESDSKYVFATLNDRTKPVSAKDFARVVIERPHPKTGQPEKLEFTRSSGQWRMAGPQAVRVDDAAVTSLVNQVMSAAKEPVKLKEGLASYGLDKPSVTVTLERDKAKHELRIGQEGPKAADPLLYVAASENPNQPLAVKKSALDKLYQPLGDLRDKRIFSSSFGVNNVLFAGKDRPKLELTKKSDTQWEIKEPALGEADFAAVNSSTLDLTGLRIEKNEDYLHDGKPEPAQLKKFGLTPEDASYIVTISQPAPGDGTKTLSETLLIGQPDPSGRAEGEARRAAGQVLALASAGGSGFLALLPAAEMVQETKPDVAEEARYAMKQGEDAIFRLSAKQWQPLKKGLNDFRAKSLLSLDAASLDAINLTAGGETLRLRKPTLKSDGSAPADWVLFTDSRAKVTAQVRQVQQLVDALNRVAARDGSSFLDDDAALKNWFGAEVVDLGLDKPQAEMLLWVDGLERDKDGKIAAAGEPAFKEAAKSKPTARILIGRRDPKRQVVYVKRALPGQKPTILALPDPWIAPPIPGMPPDPDAPRQAVSLTDLTTAGYLAFRDHSLPSPRPMEVARMQVERPNEKLLLERKNSSDGGKSPVVLNEWHVVEPFQSKSPLADSVVNVLTQLGADKLVTDRPTDRDLEEKFGLGTKPFMKFTLSGQPNADKKAAEYIYTIGRRTEPEGKHPNHYYARLEFKPLSGSAPESNQFVFVLSSAQAELLAQELRDTIVFPFEGTKRPQLLTFTWRTLDAAKKLQESKLELGLAEDKKTWFVKSLTVAGKDEKASLPKLDQAKLNWMAGLANDLRAQANGPRLNPLVTERFLVHDGEPTPEMCLDPARADAPPPLVVDMQFEGGDKRQLIVGQKFEPKEPAFPFLAGRLFFFGKASTLPRAVFLLPQADHQGLLAGPQFFKPAEAVSSR